MMMAYMVEILYYRRINQMSEQLVKDEINEFLKGELLKNALDFMAFLKENEMIAGGHHGEVSYKNNSMCFIHIGSGAERPNPWTIYIEGDYNAIYGDTSIDERLKEIAWANVHFCGSCGGGCPEKTVSLFGKEFNNVCNAELAFYKPDTEALECVKKLLVMRKREILEKI